MKPAFVLDPIRTTRNDRPVWLWPDGKVLPVIAGGDGPTPPAPTPPTPTPPAPVPPAPPAPTLSAPPPGPGFAADGETYQFPANTPIAEMTEAQRTEYWRHKARKHEDWANERRDYDDLKAKATQYDALSDASKTEQQRAIETARAEATETVRAEERSKANIRLVDAEMRAAVAGRLTPEQLAVILDPIDRTKFVNADGEVDNEKIIAFVAGVAPAAEPGKNGKFPDLGQGRRGTPASGAPSVQSGKDLYQARHGRKTPTS
jgi:hypothetical protein